MPTAKELQGLGRSDLNQAILRAGGYVAVADRLKWQSRRRARGAYDDAATAAQAVAAFVAAKGGGDGRGAARQMPTHAELRAAGRHDLRHALQVHGSGAIAALAGLEPSRQGGRSRVGKGWVEALAAEGREQEEGGDSPEEAAAG